MDHFAVNIGEHVVVSPETLVFALFVTRNAMDSLCNKGINGM